MGKDKFRKRKERKRLIRAEMLRRDIKVREIAVSLRHPTGEAYTVQAVYKGMTSSPKVMAALIEAGVPARLFGKDAPASQPKSPLTPLYKGGEGSVDGEQRQKVCAAGGE